MTHISTRILTNHFADITIITVIITALIIARTHIRTHVVQRLILTPLYLFPFFEKEEGCKNF